MSKADAWRRYEMLEGAIEKLESQFGPQTGGVGAIGRGVDRLRAMQAECYAVLCS